MRVKDLPTEFRARILTQRRQARQAAENFAGVCEEGRADQLENAAKWLDEQADAWRPAMGRIARLPSVRPEIRDAFIPIWVEHKMPALFVGNRPVLAAALRLLMPGNYSGPPLALYRGTSGGERRRRLYGFSWTTDVAIARKFAENWAQRIPGIETEGVILKTIAPPEAILLIRQPEDYYDEGEVVVDPFRLGKISLVERL